MQRIEGEQFQAIKPYFDLAADVAKDATCLRAQCGSVIILDGEVIGSGYNSPALDDESQRMCEAEMNILERPKYDKTCCIHAEWRAVMQAASAVEKLAGSTLYFMRINEQGEYTDAGDPFCTVCSRLTLDAGVSNFALYNEGGADVYPASEYNLKSYSDYIK